MALYKYVRSSFIRVKYQRFIIVFIGAVLAAGMMVGCNQPATVGIGSQPAEAISPANELGIVIDKDMKVLDLESGGAAEKAGLQVGDLLDTVDGVSVAQDREKVKALIRDPQKDKKITLKIKRADKDMEVEISPAPPIPHPDAPTPTPVFAPQDYF